MCAPFPATPGPTEFRPVLVFFGPTPPTPQQLPSLWCCLWEKGAPDLTTCVAPAFPVPPRPEAAEVPNATGSSRHAWDTRHACSLQASRRCAHMHTRGTRSTHACPIPDTERAHTPPYKKRRCLSRTLPRASTVRTARRHTCKHTQGGLREAHTPPCKHSHLGTPPVSTAPRSGAGTVLTRSPECSCSLHTQPHACCTDTHTDTH